MEVVYINGIRHEYPDKEVEESDKIPPCPKCGRELNQVQGLLRCACGKVFEIVTDEVKAVEETLKAITKDSVIEQLELGWRVPRSIAEKLLVPGKVKWKDLGKGNQEVLKDQVKKELKEIGVSAI